jgi:hypothetical protein
MVVVGQQWLRMVLDEAHTIRNGKTQQAKVRLAVWLREYGCSFQLPCRWWC